MHKSFMFCGLSLLLLSGCSTLKSEESSSHKLMLGQFTTKGYNIGITIENYPKGFIFSDENNPTPVKYRVEGSAAKNCIIDYIDNGQSYKKGRTTGTTYAYDIYDEDFLAIICENAAPGTYQAKVTAKIKLNDEEYKGSRTFSLKVGEDSKKK